MILTTHADYLASHSTSSQPLNKGRADKGPAWPEYLRQLQGQVEVKGGPPGGSPIPGSKNQTTVVNMAFSAATCDNHLFPRAIFGKPIPDIGDQIDLIQNGFNGTLQPGFGPHSVVNTVNGDTDVALIWIGTNDLNFFTANVTENGLFNGNATVTDPLRRGSIIDYVDCIFRRFSQLYEFGYRKFVLLEMIPLELTPYYNTDQVIDPQTGVVPFGLPTVIQQNVLSANFMYPYKAQDFERKYAGAQVEIFPAHELFKRFYFSPQEYGFKNVTSACYYCPTVDDGDLWADALHPSARADRILASKLSRFLKGDRGDALLKGQM